MVGGLIALVVSDALLPLLVSDHGRLHELQAVKGAIEVGVTAAILFAVALYSHRSLSIAQNRIEWDQEVQQVLLRVLRHDIRNEMTVVRGHAESIQAAADDDRTADFCENIIESTDALLDQSETINDIRDLMAGTTEQQTFELTQLLAGLVEQTDESAGVQVHLGDVPTDDVSVTANSLLPAAITELVDNAIQHNDASDPWVDVSLEEGSDSVTVRIADNGPGIPESEREVVTEGMETPLNHSSGLGLWTATWIASASNGSIEIVDRRPHGTLVELTLPTAATRSQVTGR